MADVQPFKFEIDNQQVSYPCTACKVYVADVAVLQLPTGAHSCLLLALCRSCLRRMRATLKLAEKTLPPLPKRVRPSMNRPVLLIDGNHLARRSYYTVGRTLRTSDGKASGAIYGTLNSLRKIAMKFAPCRLVVFFDGGYTEATKIFAGYKAGRVRDPADEFHEQCDATEDLVGYMGVTTVNVDGVEADTLIGVASRLLVEATGGKHSKAIIVSSDHDMYQLLSNHVEVYDDLKNRAVTQAELSEFYVGCTPRDIIGLKALMGDCSDNVPGLPGMGEGTALEVLRHVEGYKGVVQMSKKGGRYPLPDPEDFEKKIRFRVAKAFADPIAARKILRRNLKLVRIPKTLEKLPVSIRQEFVSQLTETPAVMHHEIEIALKKYQINSILGRVEAWMKPLVVAGRI